jgi:pimeloyl-ACP methyl ester carboxylesterase
MTEEESAIVFPMPRLRRVMRDVCYSLLRKSRLLSPWLWWRVAQQQRTIDTLAWKRHLRQAFMAILLPPLFMHGVDLALWQGSCEAVRRIAASPGQLRSAPTTSTTLLASTAATYVAANSLLMWKVVLPLRQVATSLYEACVTQRSRTRSVALELIDQLAAEGRFVASFSYDVYLPSLQNVKAASQAILFLPGAGVAHRAYARAMHLLADLGYIVVVVSAEPLRRIAPGLGHTADYFRRMCMHPVSTKYPQISTWLLAGHSMGAFGATQVAQELGINTVVMWAAAPFVAALADLSQTTTRVAVIQGSNDALLPFVLEKLQPPGIDLVKEFWAKLPPHAQEFVIEQGTHAGFADYQSKSLLEDDDGLSREAQQQQAVRLTHQYFVETGAG